MSIFPDVPPYPGVPPLLRNLNVTQVLPALLRGDFIGALQDLLRPVWGLFKDGQPVLAAQTVSEFAFKAQWRISDYPVEQGGFQSFNKVIVPYDARLQIVCSLSLADRVQLLSSIEAIAGDTNTYDIVTPERLYTEANVVDYDYFRSAQDGVTMIKANMYLRQINQSAQFTFTNTNVPTSLDETNDGTVNPIDATSAETGQLDSFR